MIRHAILLSLLMAIVCPGPAMSQIALDSTHIVIGNQTELTVSHANRYPTLEELSQNSLVALRQWFDTASETQHTLMTCFEPGEHWLRLGDDSVLLTVYDVADVDTASDEIRDIADIETVPLTFWDAARWVLLALIAVLLAAAAWYTVQRVRNRQPVVKLSAKPPLPPHTRALNALETLRRKQLWQQGAVKDYHTELTDIVRQYLEERCGITSSEMTSDQTLEAFAAWWGIHRDGSESNPEELLDGMLRTADMVKFAKSEPLPYEHDRSMAQAIALVEALIPKNEVHE